MYTSATIQNEAQASRFLLQIINKCDMAVATRTFFDMMADRQSITAMLFGDACYNVTGPMVQIAHQWGMFQLSYGDTNPMLSDRDEFPNFYRTVPSDNDFNPARLALLRHFNWTTVGTLVHAKLGRARHAMAHDRFVTLMEKNKINISVMESFADDPEDAVKSLKAHDVRIIVCNFDQVVARRVFCRARQHELFGPKFQWIVLGTYDLDWWTKEADSDVPCTPEELNDTLHGYLATDVLPLSSSDEVTESGKTPQEYLHEYEIASGGEYSKYHGYAYDGVWVVAKAVDRLLDDVTVWATHTFRGPPVGKVLNDTSFIGVTGRVQFLNGDRLGSTKLLQMQYGVMVKVGEYHAIPDHLDLSSGDPIVWRSNDPPVDRSIKIEELRDVSFPVYIGLVVIAAMGITMAVLFLALNIHFRRHSYIKMSSPNMNNLIIVGCILCYQSIILLGVEPDKKAEDVVFRYWCTARSWTLALGFTLAFGAMFGKTWRVHAIFTNIKLNKKVIKDYKLMLIVLVLVLMDAVILVTWQIVDPIQKATKKLSPEVYGDFEIIPKINYCTSQYMEIWLGALYAYKGLLLAFGCFLAWVTRHVSIPALNDSKYIGMSVYNVVIMCVCGAALSFVIQDKPTTSFIIIGLFIIFCTTITLCLVFLPKIIQLKRNPNGDDSRVRATLRKTTRKVNKIESSQLKERIRLSSEENRRLRGTLEQKVSDLEDLLHQLGDARSIEDARHVTSNALLNIQVQDYVYQSPGRLSIKSYNGAETDTASMYSVASAATTTMFITEDSPVHQNSRLVKVNHRLHGNRMGAEVIEMAGVRYCHRKSSVTLPPAAEEEEDQICPEIGQQQQQTTIINNNNKKSSKNGGGGGNTWRNKFSFVWNDKKSKFIDGKGHHQTSSSPAASAPSVGKPSVAALERASTINEDSFGGVYLGPDEPSETNCGGSDDKYAYCHRKNSVTLPPAAEEEDDQICPEIGQQQQQTTIINNNNKKSSKNGSGGGHTWRNKFSFVWNDKRSKFMDGKGHHQMSSNPTASVSSVGKPSVAALERASSINEDSFGGVYLGPDEPSETNCGGSDDKYAPKKMEENRENEPLLLSYTGGSSSSCSSNHPSKNSTSGITRSSSNHHNHQHHHHPVLEHSNGTNVLVGSSFGSLDTNSGNLTRKPADNTLEMLPNLHALRGSRIDASFQEISASDDIVLL